MPRRIVRADGATLRAWRQARGWDAPEMARRLRAAAREVRQPAAGHEGLVRMVYGWERGDHALTERYALLYARALGIAMDALEGGPLRRASDLPVTGEASEGDEVCGALPSTAEDVFDVLNRIQKVHRSTVHPDIVRHL